MTVFEFICPFIPSSHTGEVVTLSSAAEEVAGFFAALIGSLHAENAKFCANFFADFLTILKENDPVGWMTGGVSAY